MSGTRAEEKTLQLTAETSSSLLQSSLLIDGTLPGTPPVSMSHVTFLRTKIQSILPDGASSGLQTFHCFPLFLVFKTVIRADYPSACISGMDHHV